jgi:16S rRNA (guanine527-N7)-methyltransferase
VRSNDAGSGSPRRQRVHPQEGYPGRQRDPLPTRVSGLPELPTTYAAALDAGLRELGLALPPDARAALDGHVRLLLAWNAAINLTAIRDPADVARLHVLDSLAAVAVVRRLGAGRLLDLGSGGGFPGWPLAVAVPAEALLVDSVGKKARFLETVAAALGRTDVAVAATRAEALAEDPRHREAWPLVTARAVSSLAELVELGFPLLRSGGTLLAWKRGELDAELAAAGPAIEALGSGEVDVHDVRVRGLEGHRLVAVRKRGRTPEGWPRDPATRRRRPW